MSEPKQARIKLDSAIVDYSYQRPVEEKRVARIVDEFNPRQIGVLEVSKRENGTHAIIDGQHRFEAMKALGRKQAVATVHEGLSRQDEARLFAKLNMSRSPLKPYQRFRAQVFSGDPQAVAISKAITAAGFKLATGNVTVTTIGAIRATETAFKLLGEERFAEMLVALRDCWFGMVGSLDANVFAGFSMFWDQYGDRCTDDHIERLKRADPMIILQNSRARALAKGLSLSGGSRNSVNIIIGDAIRKATGMHTISGRRQAGRPEVEKKARVEA